MIDLPSLAFVLGGTLAATLLQAGWRACALTLSELGVQVLALFGLARARRFDAARVKADLLRQMADVARDGLVRVQIRRIDDREFRRLAQAMLAARSAQALAPRHQAMREKRQRRTQRAITVCQQAADLAPVLGLAGTLLALGRLGVAGEAGAQAGAMAGVAAGSVAAGLQASPLAMAIGMAVSTTLYGVVLANLVFMPLGGLIERRARREDAAREEVFAWLQEQAASALRPERAHPMSDARIVTAIDPAGPQPRSRAAA